MGLPALFGIIFIPFLLAFIFFWPRIFDGPLSSVLRVVGDLLVVISIPAFIFVFVTSACESETVSDNERLYQEGYQRGYTSAREVASEDPYLFYDRRDNYTTDSKDSYEIGYADGYNDSAREILWDPEAFYDIE